MNNLVRRSVLCASILLVVGASAHAAVTRISGPNTVYDEGRKLVFFDAAYDSQDHVYLAAWGTQLFGPVNGMLFNDSGQQLSGLPFALSDGVIWAGWTRIIYSPETNRFLVTYVKIVGTNHHQKGARFVTISNNAAVLGPEIILDDWIGDSGSASGMAYSTASGKFLVTWSHYSGSFPVTFVATIDTASTPSCGPAIGPCTVISFAGDGETNSEIACDPVNRRCLVIGEAWGILDGSGKSAFWYNFISDSTGAPVSSPQYYFNAGGALQDAPAVTYMPATSAAPARFLVATGYGGTILGFYGDASTLTVGAPFAMIKDTTGTEGSGYGFVGMKYNSASKTTIATMTTWTGSGAVQELDGAGSRVAGGFNLIPEPLLNPGNANSGNDFTVVAINNNTAGFMVLENVFYEYIRQSMFTGTGGVSTPQALSVGFTASPSTSVVEGSPITWTASSSGGTAPIQFEFITETNGIWTIGQGYSTLNTFTWFPTAGTHSIQVWAKNNGSTKSYDAFAAMQFTVRPRTASISSLQADTNFPVDLNVPVTWTATGTGGTAPLQYKFLATTNGGVTWHVMQDYSTNNRFTWYPPLGVNTNAVQVWVRSSGATADPEGWMSSGLFTTRSTGARLTSVSRDSAADASTSPFTLVSFSATGAGGSGPLEYKFWLLNLGTGTWSLVRDWSTSTKAAWDPNGTPGLFLVQAWVRTVNSGVTYEDWRNTDLFSVTTSTGLTLTADRSLSTLRQGDMVTFTATVSGGTGPWEYEFFTFDGVNWVRQAPGYKSSNTFSWFPLAGTKAVQVWIRQAGSTAPWERWATTGLFFVNP